MLPFSEIRGQDRVIALLKRAIESDRVAQAYLFTGPKGAGKHSTAIALAMALNCHNDSLGCTSCSSCQKIAEGIHPDIRVLETQGAQKRIAIETIRKDVIPSLALPPHEGKYRVFIVEEATSMAGPSANALLKTLEEPPPRTLFILSTTSPTKLLPTIRSRCQRISFRALSAGDRAQIEGEEGDESLGAMRDLVTTWLEQSDAKGLVGIVDAAKDVGDRDKLLGLLQAFAEAFHDKALTCVAEGQLQRAQVYGSRVREVLKTLKAVRDHNAHGQLAAEDLLVHIRALPLPQEVSP